MQFGNLITGAVCEIKDLFVSTLRLLSVVRESVFYNEIRLLELLFANFKFIIKLPGITYYILANS